MAILFSDFDPKEHNLRDIALQDILYKDQNP
jgi:hypothetical protein